MVASLYRALSHVLASSSVENVGSEESKESDTQDKDEAAVATFLQHYLDFTISDFQLAGTLDNTPMAILVRSVPFAKGVWLQGALIPCKTDGSVAVAIASGKRSTTTRTQFPIALECRRLLYRKPASNIVCCSEGRRTDFHWTTCPRTETACRSGESWNRTSLPPCANYLSGIFRGLPGKARYLE
ncbi:uncharacterized protein EV422DRAFT_325902 [Fimicolochytrium jonesii]|uniref:uncharacterized protein n=1 Tax=Fimicolochytrium jonesii TaxID=1396493 RepID=UPI0022FEBA03|nr:uncharacterized protein EV422DRAFT_325902 [Fimicolochytrium jonesii]KAI8824574.1 hypothetical protein EV422DRAFT_325902 [Fimicolochytrium jonesii]